MSDDERHIGVEPAPDDEQLVKWLNEKFYDADQELKDYLTEFWEVVKITREDKEPIEFAYARLLNNLATFDHPKLLRMLSAFIWRMSK